MTFLFISPPFGNYFPEYIFNNIFLDNNKYKLKSIVGSFTLEPRSGLIMQIIKTLRYSNEHNGWTNKIGLRNKGVEWAVKNYYKNNNIDNIVSVALIKHTDIDHIHEIIPKDMNIEVNISCPNIDKSINIYDGVEKFINLERDWCIIKIPPTISYKEIDYLYNQGWRQFHCCNTIPIKEGGLSGVSLRPYTNHLTSYISNTYSDTIIISGGGIIEKDNINEYKKNGATHFSISTLMFNPLKFLKLLYDVK
jgi:dihydroorotate dehydrogenase